MKLVVENDRGDYVLADSEAPKDRSHWKAFIIGIITGVLLSLTVVSFAQSDGSARTLSGKRDQLFRVINEVRRVKGMQPLNYQSDDQPLATLRAKALVKVFRPDTLSCMGEVIYQGSYGYVVSKVSSIDAQSYQYDPMVSWASVGLVEKRGRYYLIVRVF